MSGPPSTARPGATPSAHTAVARHRLPVWLAFLRDLQRVCTVIKSCPFITATAFKSSVSITRLESFGITATFGPTLYTFRHGHCCHFRPRWQRSALRVGLRRAVHHGDGLLQVRGRGVLKEGAPPRACSEKSVRLAQKIQVGPCISAVTQLGRAEVGPTSGQLGVFHTLAGPRAVESF
jgi:hypothetical protein